MTDRKIAGLSIAGPLHDFIVDEALPGTGVSAEQFFDSMASIISDFSQRNAQCMDKRDELQSSIDDWHIANPGAIDAAAYRAFLEKIGYLETPVSDFKVNVSNVDAEIATLAGPQLVVPVNNARYALNAANARWGSLYDALYGTDVISSEGGAEPSVEAE